jgi:hypothetical protein
VQCLLKRGELFQQEWRSAENETEIMQRVLKMKKMSLLPKDIK